MSERLMEYVDSVENSIHDLAVDSMINEMLLHYQELGHFEPWVVANAKVRTSSYIEQYSRDLLNMWPCLREAIFEHKKIALASVKLGGSPDETAIPIGILQSESERSAL